MLPHKTLAAALASFSAALAEKQAEVDQVRALCRQAPLSAANTTCRQQLPRASVHDHGTSVALRFKLTG